MAPHDGGTATLTYPFAAAMPPAGTILEMAPGVHWLRMTLPFALDHINLWLLEDGDGWTIVDTGIATPETKISWERIFVEALGGRPVTRVLVTHFHPDHMGLAGWLCARWKAPLFVTEGEWLWARMLSSDRDDDAHADEQRPFYKRAGVELELTAIFAERGNQYWRRVTPVPRGYRRLSDGQEVTIGGHAWRVVIGRGHAPEHACLWCPELDVFIAGDQVLPKISPNVSVWPSEPEADPLSLYLASLRKIAGIVPPSVLVLPSHNLPFRGLDVRIQQLLDHHEERLARLETACVEPHTAADCVPVLFRRQLDHQQYGFAIGETLAHLHCLVGRGRLTIGERDDGVRVFVRA